jgi:hypothetical protein
VPGLLSNELAADHRLVSDSAASAVFPPCGVLVFPSANLCIFEVLTRVAIDGSDCRAENTLSEFVGKLVIGQILLYPASGVCLVRLHDHSLTSASLHPYI